jgi:hypothetical protein
MMTLHNGTQNNDTHPGHKEQNDKLCNDAQSSDTLSFGMISHIVTKQQMEI